MASRTMSDRTWSALLALVVISLVVFSAAAIHWRRAARERTKRLRERRRRAVLTGSTVVIHAWQYFDSGEWRGEISRDPRRIREMYDAIEADREGDCVYWDGATPSAGTCWILFYSETDAAVLGKFELLYGPVPSPGGCGWHFQVEKRYYCVPWNTWPLLEKLKQDPSVERVTRDGVWASVIERAVRCPEPKRRLAPL